MDPYIGVFMYKIKQSKSCCFVIGYFTLHSAISQNLFSVNNFKKASNYYLKKFDSTQNTML